MNEYDRRVKIIEALCCFCPICGSELVTEIVTIQCRVMPSLSGPYSEKICPNGHGIMGSGPVEGDLAPHATFQLDEKLYDEV